MSADIKQMLTGIQEGMETKFTKMEEDALKRAQDDELRDEEIRRLRAANPNERVQSGEWRGIKAGSIALGLAMAARPKGSAPEDSEYNTPGFARIQDGLEITSDKAHRYVRALEDMYGERLTEMRGNTRVVKTTDITNLTGRQFDADLWDFARDNNSFWQLFRSPSGTVKDNTRVALRNSPLYLTPMAQTATNYPVDDRIPGVTVRSMDTLASSTSFTPESLLDADVDIFNNAYDDLLVGADNSLNYGILRWDNSTTGNVNSNGFTLPGSLTDKDLLLARTSANKTGLIARCLNDDDRHDDTAKTFTYANVSKNMDILPGDHQKLIIAPRGFTNGMLTVSELATEYAAGRLAGILNGTPRELFTHRLIRSEVFPRVGTDGKVGRNSASGALLTTNNKLGYVVVDPQAYELAFGIRPTPSIDKIVANGNTQISIRSYVSFVGRNDGTQYTSGTTEDNGAFYSTNYSA